MFLHVPSAWLGMLGWALMTRRRARHAGVAPSARRRRRQGGRADRRRLHLPVPGHRLALGPPDVGYLLGVGRAADLGADPVPALSRGDRALAHGGRSLPRAARAAAILTLVGAINLPIIKFSVDWWNTLHQPASVFACGGPTIHAVDPHAASRHGGRFHAAVCDACISPPCATKSCAGACARCG